MSRHRSSVRSEALLSAALALALASAASPMALAEGTSGKALYERACASCHGPDGRGRAPKRVGFPTPLPDFTDCSFATREPDPDWVGVAHEGGPTRGFAPMMPAFGDAMTAAELQRIMDHVRGFCPDDDWPRGDLNLPRAMFTSKAFIEDEAVVTLGSEVDEPFGMEMELVYETRFGARNQIEFILPFGLSTEEIEGANGDIGDAHLGVGDVAVGLKRVMAHNLDSGSIFSVAGEVILPTGDEAEGLSKGTVIFEPFLAYGQILPWESFLHLQVGAELPLDSDQAEYEGFARGALGTTFTQGEFGRAWSPMVEVLGKRELEDGAATTVDVVPQLQVALNTRQHVLANLAVKIPVTEREGRSPAVFLYVLLDWFDGGLLEGW